MGNIWKIFVNDLKSLIKHPIAFAIIIGLCVLPSLYAWFNIFANWDPYSNTGGIPVAVVSVDKGYTTKDGTVQNMGAKIVENLHDNSSVDWQFLETEEEAKRGVMSGEYYGAIVITEKFSYQMFNVFADDFENPAVIYYQNQKSNAIATKITDTVASTLKKNINKSFVETVTKTIFEEGNTLSEELEDSDYSATLKAKVESLCENLTNYSIMLDSFSDGNERLEASIRHVNHQIPKMQERLGKTEKDLEQSGKDLNSTRTTLATFSVHVDTAMTNINNSLALIEKDLNQSTLANDTANLVAAMHQTAVDVNTLNQQLDDLMGVLIDQKGAVEGDDDTDDTTDAGAGSDNGGAADAGAGNDNGGAADAGAGNDNGGAADAGAGNDNGGAANAGAGNDNGGAADAGAGNDNGGAADAGAGNDNGGAADAGAGNDNGGAADAGAGSESGDNGNGSGNSQNNNKPVYDTTSADAAIATLKAMQKQLALVNNVVGKVLESTGNASAENAKQMVLDSTATMTKAINSCQQSVANMQNMYKNNLIPQMQSVLDNMQDALTQVTSLVNTLDKTMGNTTIILDNVQDAIEGTDESMEQIKTVVDKMVDKLTTLSEQLDGATEEEAINLLVAFLGGDPENYGVYFSEPVTMQTIEIYPVATYGSAMTPFYTALAIWVGSTILVAIVKVKAAPKGLKDLRSAQLYFGRYLLFFVLAQIQGAIIAAGDILLLKVNIVEPGLFFLAVSFTATTFSLIIYSLTLAFGDVGKAVCVIVMVLQIAGSSGTFPIELLPEVYQKIYIFFPFPYAIKAMREALAGMYGTDYMEALAKLMIFMLAALLIGLVIRIPFVKLNHFMEERMEETEMM